MNAPFLAAIALAGLLPGLCGCGSDRARGPHGPVPAASDPAVPHAAPLALAPPGPNSPDEPMAESLSLARAAEFLDAASLHWTRKQRCGTCHTNFPYLMARPALAMAGSPALAEIRAFFEKRATNWDTDPPAWDAEVVYTATALAFHDAQSTGALHPVTRTALDRMWTLQRPDGSWDWLKYDTYPAEADDYFGVAVAAIGVGAAPGGYAGTPSARAGLRKMRAWLEAHPPPNLHHALLMTWASARLPDLMPSERREAAVRELLALQRLDGGWSLPSLGDWKRRSGKPNDRSGAPSDGYATGLAVYVLRQTGRPVDDAPVRRGADWLRTHQRRSGRWFTRSLNDDTRHYITHAGTAYAVMALKACGVE